MYCDKLIYLVHLFNKQLITASNFTVFLKVIGGIDRHGDTRGFNSSDGNVLKVLYFEDIKSPIKFTNEFRYFMFVFFPYRIGSL